MMSVVSHNRVLSKEDVLSHATELSRITRKQCELNQYEEAFIGNYQTFPKFSKFLKILKGVHQSLFNILVKSRKGKRVEQECREAKDLVFKLSDILMEVVNQPQLQHFQVLMKTIINCVAAMQQGPKYQLDILLVTLAYTKDLISLIANQLENISEYELLKYNDVFSIVSDKLEVEECIQNTGNRFLEAFKLLKLKKNKSSPVTHHVEQVLDPVPVNAGLPQGINVNYKYIYSKYISDLIFLGTNGYITALNLSTLSHMKKQEITKSWERSISSRVVFCLHPKCSALFLAYV